MGPSVARVSAPSTMPSLNKHPTIVVPVLVAFGRGTPRCSRKLFLASALDSAQFLRSRSNIPYSVREVKACPTVYRCRRHNECCGRGGRRREMVVVVNERTRMRMHARVRVGALRGLLAPNSVHRPSLRPHHSPRCAPRCLLVPPRTSKIESSYLSQPNLDMAASWKSLQSGLANLNLGQSANKLTRGLSSTVQATKERLGQVSAEDITELPQGTCAQRYTEGSTLMSVNPTQNTRILRPVWMHSVRRTSPCSSVSDSRHDRHSKLMNRRIGSRRSTSPRRMTTPPQSRSRSRSWARLSGRASLTLPLLT